MVSNELASLPTTGDIDLWTEAQKGLADFIGMTARIDGQVTIAPRGVREAYLIAVERTGLDPIARQIYLLYMGGKWLVVVGIDGFRLIAERTGQYRGQSRPEWTDGSKTEKPFLVDGKPYVVDGKVITDVPTTDWTDVWIATTNPVAARVFVHREGFIEPTEGLATWAGYGKTTGQWKSGNGPHMLAKCAEALALRKAFPQELSGLYTADEVESGVPTEAVPTTDWEAKIESANTEDELADVFFELTEVEKEWTPRLDARVKARMGTLRAKAADAAVVDAEVVTNG